MIPASPRLRPRHMRLVIALSEARRTSSATSPPPAGANNCASSTTTSAGYQWSRGASNRADEEGGGAAHLAFGFEPFEAEDDRGAMLADAGGGAGDLLFVMLRRFDREVAVGAGEGDEIAFGIDDDLLHLPGALFEQAAQQVRLAATRIALDEQTGGEQFLEIDGDGLALRRKAHVDGDGHVICRLRWRRSGNTRLRRSGATAKAAHVTDPHQLLKQVFGFDHFRGVQEEVVGRVLTWRPHAGDHADGGGQVALLSAAGGGAGGDRAGRSRR